MIKVSSEDTREGSAPGLSLSSSGGTGVCGSISLHVATVCVCVIVSEFSPPPFLVFVFGDFCVFQKIFLLKYS